MSRSWRLRVAFIVFIVASNVLALILPIDYGALGQFSYAGAFLLTLVANATLVLPIPYWPIFGHLAATAPTPALIVLAGALGSVLGESVGFAVGRAGQNVAHEHRLARLMARFAHRPIPAGLILFALAVPINPLFDIAGIAAGALGVSYRVFFVAVSLGRGLRFGLLAYFALRLAAS